jgi:hypothetical protein
MINMKQLTNIFLLFCLFTLSMWMSGCAVDTPGSSHYSVFETPKSLHAFSVSLDFILVIALLVFATCVALYFVLPEGHTLSLTLGAVSGATEAIAILLKVSLWIVPWIAGLALLGAVGAGAYELYEKYYGTSTTPPAVTATPGVTKTA